MKIISAALNEKLLEMAKGNKELGDLICNSNIECFGYAPYNNNAYYDLKECCEKAIMEKMREMDRKMSEDKAVLYIEHEELSQIIADNMPEQADSRFEIAMSNGFDHYTRPNGDVAEENEEDLSVYVRSWIDENLYIDLKEQLNDLWNSVQDEDPENESVDEDEKE